MREQHRFMLNVHLLITLSGEYPGMAEALKMTNAVTHVAVEISVVLGKATMPIHQLLKMGRGAIIELDARVEDHAWIYANNKLIARGEVMVVDGKVAVSITSAVQEYD